MRRPAPIPAGARARAARGAAIYLLLASLWIGASDQLLYFVVQDSALLAGIGMTKGIFFVVVTALLLYVLLLRLERGFGADKGAPASGQRGVVLTFLILAALVPLAGTGIVHLQEPRFEQVALNDLHAISDLKASQIESWLQEWRADADVLMASAEFAEDVERWRRSGDAGARQSMLGIIESFENVHRYDVHVLDADGRPLLPDATRPYQVEEPHRAMLAAAMATRQMQVSDLYRDAAGRIRYDLAVPLIRRIAGEPEAVGVAVMRAPVEQFLFPLIQTWPTPSPSGETVLVRRDGDDVLFLNELRHRRNTALSFRLAIDAHPRLPAAIGLLQGRAATVRDGIDYRGVPVLAVVRPIRGTSWHLVTKLDRDEVQAPLRQLIWWVGLLALVAVACVAVAVVMLWRQQQRANRLQLAAQAADKDRLLKLFYDLPFMGMAMTSPTSRRFLYVNDGLCAMLGYRREELLEMTWMEIVHPEDLHCLADQSERLLRGEAEAIEAEVRCLRKDGSSRIVDIDVRGAKGADDRVDVVVIVAQDITEKREATQALAKREREFHTLADNVPDNIVRYDLDGRVRYVNRALERTVGVPASILIGTFARDTAPDGRFDALEAAVLRVGTSGKAEELEQILPGPDGKPLYHLISIVPEPGPDGAPVSVLAVGRDLTELKLADERTRQAATVFESTRESVVIADLDGNMLAVNKAFTEITGYSEAEALGRNPRILKSGRQGPEFYQTLWATLLATGQWQGEIWNRRRNGEVYPAWMTISAVRDDQGRPTHYVCVTTDISQIKRSEEQLAHLAHFDPLTDLPNRLLLQSRLAHALDRAARRGQRAAVLFIDLDRFKTVNDSLGHVVGDQLLVDAARRLAKRVRDEDTLGRFGGDEFLLVLEPIGLPEDAASVARDLLATLAAPFQLAGGAEVYVGASIGIAVYPDDSTDAADLLRDADAAMYQAKEHGRNRFCFYTADMNANAVAQLELEAALRRAVERGEFVLHYQPKADLRTGQVFSAEALIRWQPEGQEMVPPGRFISLAEKTGLIVPIGTWVIDAACRQLRAWHDEGMRELRLAVNVSGRQFHSGDLPAVVAGALARHEVDAACLELELTESILMDDPEQTIAILQELKRIGVKLSLDDFGTGYSSFAYLSRFPIDALKIDQSFVRNIVTEPQAAMIAVSIIDLAHRLGLRVVAEGVETEAQLGYLRQRDCDEMQGYLFARPMPPEAFDTLLYQGRSLQLTPADSAPDSRTLLLVDDEPNILSALQRLLRREGYRILTADCAARGLELLAMHSVQVIVSDQRMPGMTGTEFLTRVKDLHPDTVRIVLTGYTDLESVTQAVNGGAIYKFLAKPWNDGQLREHIRDAFLYHEAIIKPRAVQRPS